MPATLDARIGLDSSAFSSGMSRVVRESNAAVGKMSASFGSLRNVLGAGAAGAFLMSYGRDAVDAAAQVEKLERMLAHVSGGANAAAIEMERLREVALLPGLDLNSAVEATVRLRAMGFTSQEAESHLKSLSNVVATFGGSGAEMDGVIRALSQISSKGVISAEEINQIAERMPSIRQDMEAAFGTSNTETLQKMNISAKEFVDTLMQQWSKLPPVVAGIREETKKLGMEFDRWLAGAGEVAAPVVGLTFESMKAVREQIAFEIESSRRLIDVLGTYTPLSDARNFEGRMDIRLKDQQQRMLAEAEAEKKKTELIRKQVELVQEMDNLRGDELAKLQKYNDALDENISKIQASLGPKFKNRTEANDEKFALDNERMFGNEWAMQEGIEAGEAFFDGITQAARDAAAANEAAMDEGKAAAAKMFEKLKEDDDKARADGMQRGEAAKNIVEGKRRDFWDEKIEEAAMTQDERRSDRQQKRDRKRATNLAVARESQKEIQAARKEARENAFENLKNNKFTNDLEMQRKIKEQNKKDAAPNPAEKAAITLTEIKKILETLSAA